MFEHTLLVNSGVPQGAVATPYAMMPKILCCINGKGAEVFINRKMIRKFNFLSNGLKKLVKVREREEAKAYRIYKTLTKSKPLLLTHGGIDVKTK
jgi:hypothetical protein